MESTRPKYQGRGMLKNNFKAKLKGKKFSRDRLSNLAWYQVFSYLFWEWDSGIKCLYDTWDRLLILFTCWRRKPHNFNPNHRPGSVNLLGLHQREGSPITYQRFWSAMPCANSALLTRPEQQNKKKWLKLFKSKRFGSNFTIYPAYLIGSIFIFTQTAWSIWFVVLS